MGRIVTRPITVATAYPLQYFQHTSRT